MGCRQVAVVLMYVHKYEIRIRDLSREGYMRSTKWQLEMLGTISAFVFRHKEANKSLCRGGRSQDLPNTDF